MAATSFGDAPLPLNNRMTGEPLDVRQDERRARAATMRITHAASTNERGLRVHRVAFVKVDIIDGLFLIELVATVQVFSSRTLWRSSAVLTFVLAAYLFFVLCV